MYPDISLWLSIAFMIVGFAALAWSSDLFVVGSSALARAMGISPFVIGMVVIGFGTSAPELVVSMLSGFSGHANLSLGNAYGSCVFNTAIILGVAALIAPLAVKPSVSLVAGPGLAAISLFSLWLLRDGACGRVEAAALLATFAIVMPLYCWYDQWVKGAIGRKSPSAGLPASEEHAGLAKPVLQVLAGLVVLIGSAHILVWGAVDFAKALHVSDLLIGLTIVAVGTSLPELASAIASARRGEHEFVLGNIVGSNLFNMLAVVGLATVISPVTPENGGFSRYVLTRDLPLLTLLSLSITVFGVNWRSPRSPGAITRPKALVWLLVFVAYTALMFIQETHG
ncbi:MAG: calcium/sodium antiporter [Kiritimatiellae bacterium]|nr:calcium/sodium antiporter [Kiritimatiellia bacterium]